MDTLKANISKNFEEKGVYYFEIEFSCGEKKWICKKRYNDFYELNTKLAIMFGQHIPPFPGKALFSSSSSTAEKRKLLLEVYTNECIKIPTLIDCSVFQGFSEVEQNIPSAIKERPKLMGQINKCTNKILHMALGTESNCLFTVENLAGMGVFASSFFSKTFYGWLKKWKIVDSDQITIEIAFEIPFEKSISYLRVIKGDTILIGLVDGQFFVYDYNGQLIFTHKSHSNRIKGIEYLPDRKAVVTIGYDKQLIVTDIPLKIPISKVPISDYKLTDMKTKDQLLYISDKAGVVRIFNSKELPPSLVLKVAISKGPIKSLSLSQLENRVFAGFCNGVVGSFTYEPTSNPMTVSTPILFNCQNKIRSIFYLERGNLVVGTSNGMLKYIKMTDCMLLHVIEFAHTMSVTSFVCKKQVSFSSSKDKVIKAWKLPDEWVSDIKSSSKIIVEDSTNIIHKEKTIEIVQNSIQTIQTEERKEIPDEIPNNNNVIEEKKEIEIPTQVLSKVDDEQNVPDKPKDQLQERISIKSQSEENKSEEHKSRSSEISLEKEELHEDASPQVKKEEANKESDNENDK